MRQEFLVAKRRYAYLADGERAVLTVGRLRELLHYNPDTGVFTRRVRMSQNTRIGDTAGTRTVNGYVHIGVEGTNYLAHRLALFYVTGEWPSEQVDHIDGNRSNNRWNNLREASAALNRQNLRTAHSDSSTGLLGVSPSFGKFEASITIDRVRHRLGRFETAQQAHQAYLAKKRELHVGCTI